VFAFCQFSHTGIPESSRLFPLFEAWLALLKARKSKMSNETAQKSRNRRPTLLEAVFRDFDAMIAQHHTRQETVQIVYTPPASLNLYLSSETLAEESCHPKMTVPVLDSVVALLPTRKMVMETTTMTTTTRRLPLP
jgi:hypothetical protein